ncbi:MAG: Methyltransferase type 12 [Candidatus Uhrbacteria bacterium GW2011_GWF2_39_13]|uniref:Methyltransferase type 12 n=1 Tax=Candidatus Uhrbacteria bacterium GW2011_GWF2_39_13 TaxID=1618995 RepID=A0A0G0Q3D0_9BACT|nr:MAG: Methyltransferase type 12 [Candidatus Uhrbacteria bacterium GW2011_GWF2_39_13]HAU66140.1 hypothetical protein [Candidatus Uhrbacteria bacterium]
MFLNLFLLILVFFLGSAAYAASKGAPWVPTWKRDLKRLVDLLDLKPGENAVELGCGNARVCRALIKAQPQAQVTGVELSFLQYGIGWLQNKLSGNPVKMIFQNVFKHDLSGYDAVYVFLMPDTYEKLHPKFEKELKPGSRVVSYVWPIPGWEPTKVNELKEAPALYLYQR